jgi:hypothetical protein
MFFLIDINLLFGGFALLKITAILSNTLFVFINKRLDAIIDVAYNAIDQDKSRG